MMSDSRTGLVDASARAEQRLDSWKEIAGYLRRDVRTVQRWEQRENLPVHRHGHQERSSVFAFRDELDHWLESRPAAVDNHCRPPPSWKGRALRLVLLAFLLPITVIGVLLIRPWLAAFPDFDPSRFPRLLTSHLGQELHPSLSPDGKAVVFSWNGPQQDNFDIYIQHQGDQTAQRKTEDPARDYSPIWSPDGLQIAFLRERAGGQSEILLLPAYSGSERALLSLAMPSPRWGPQISWSPDGNWIAASVREPSKSAFAITLVSVLSGQIRALTHPPEGFVGDHSPSFSPAGDVLAFVRTTSPGVGDLWLQSLDPKFGPTDGPRCLTDLHTEFSRPAWSPCGSQIIVSAGTWPSAYLRRVDPKGDAPPETLFQIGRASYFPALSAEHLLVFARFEYRCNIWEYDTASKRGRDLVLSSSEFDTLPEFSPARQALVFTSDRSGTQELWLFSKDSTHSTQLTQFGSTHTGHASWSPDGSSILFDSVVHEQSEIFQISSTVPAPQGSVPGRWLNRVTNNPKDDILPRWSQDGKWIYFSSNRSGTYQVWRIPQEGGRAEMVTRNGGLQTVDCPVSSCLYVSKADSEGLWKIDPASGEETQVVENCSPAFATTSRGVVFVVEEEQPKARFELRLLPYDKGPVELLGAFERHFGGGLSASPDGSSIYLSLLDEEGANLMAVDNFHCRWPSQLCGGIISSVRSLAGLE